MRELTMKLLLIVPCKNKKEREFFDFRFVAKFIGMKRGFWGIPLAVPTVAAITPSDVEVEIVDENIEEIDFNKPCDLIGITVMSLQAIRAYQIADEFRRRKRPVVLGGVHASMLPQEALEHADSVFVGEAEGRWYKVIEDFKRGELKKIYTPDPDEGRPHLGASPGPRRDLQKNHYYVANMLQTSRGCPFDCDFCSVQDFLGSKMRYKAPAQVEDEIHDIYRYAVHDNYMKQLFITDDNLVGNRKRIMEMLRDALIPMNQKFDISGWTCQCSVNVAKDLELLAMMKDAGCQHIFIGFESLSADSLKTLSKAINNVDQYSEAISSIRSFGIDVIGSFILGNDCDDTSSFSRLADFIHDNALLDNLINILVPFPGTKLFERMKAEGRILHYDWSKYDLGHVVFKPKRMSVRELEEGYIWVHQEVYALKNLYPKLRYRIWKPGKNRMSTSLKLKFTARLMSLLSPTDWDRNRFIFRVIPDVFNSNLDMQLSNIVNCMDHQDFARKLEARRKSLHLLTS
ncbi:MAG: radical SAM protein [Pseudomonadota bacterium]